jgi:uncharacterized protein
MRVQIDVTPESDAQQVVLSFFEALGSREKLIEVFDERATWTVWGYAPFSGVHEGRNAVVDGFHAETGKLFVDDGTSVLTVKTLIGMGPVVAAEFEYESPTAIGRQYHNHYVEVFEVLDGKIVHVREYMDTQHLAYACLGEGGA